MNVKQILALPDGVSGLTCCGTADYVQDAQNKTGTSNGKPYDFWTQFIVLKDGSGDVGVSLNLASNPENAVSKGQQIVIERATITSYDKDGETRRSLRAYLAQDTPTIPQNRPQQANSNGRDYDAENRGKCRTQFIKAAIIAGKLNCNCYEDVLLLTEFAMTGRVPDSIRQDNPDDDIPF